MKINSVIDKLFAVYLTLSALASLITLIVIIIGNQLTISFLIPILLSLTLLFSTIRYNYSIVFSYSISLKRSLINICVSFLQLLFVAIDGFQFKYTQGIQMVAYAKTYNGSSDFRFGLDFQIFSYIINTKFLDIDYTIIGVDILALCLFSFYVYQYKTTKADLNL